MIAANQGLAVLIVWAVLIGLLAVLGPLQHRRVERETATCNVAGGVWLPHERLCLAGTVHVIERKR